MVYGEHSTAAHQSPTALEYKRRSGNARSGAEIDLRYGSSPRPLSSQRRLKLRRWHSRCGPLRPSHLRAVRTIDLDEVLLAACRLEVPDIRVNAFSRMPKFSSKNPACGAGTGLQNLLSPVALVLGVPCARVEDKAAEFRTCRCG
jgi:hypothetical protein